MIICHERFSRFYGVTLTDDDLLEMSELLESVCPGLGCWYLDLDPEFQKDDLAGGLLFWQDRGEIPSSVSGA
jgi:hypothetical protein